MIKIEDKTNCCGCHGCLNICPVDAIEMVEDEYGFKYPKVDEKKCINCSACEKACPVINSKKVDNSPRAFACCNNDKNIRIKSSSGGVFTLIATSILNQGGVVYGAAFDENFMVKHIKVEDIDDLEKLRTSKYLQSEIGTTYKECKKILDEGRKVLFTGTPCQIEGMFSYLKKSYDNLYTQDIICHGVPSPKVWRHYLNYRNKKDGSSPVSINFRNKDNGWKRFNLKFTYKTSSYFKNQNEDLYMRAFLRDVDLRDSCYSCKFKKEHRISDITLADFWRIQKLFPEMDDDNGTSLIVVNSTKGMDLIESIKANITIKEFDCKMVSETNPAFVKSAPQNKNRDKFMSKINDDNFEEIVNMYAKAPGFMEKSLKKCKKLINKVIKIGKGKNEKE